MDGASEAANSPLREHCCLLRAFMPIIESRYGPMREAGVDLKRLKQPGYRLSLYRVFRLLKLAEQRSADPMIGFHLDCHVGVRSYEVLGYVLMSCRILQEALQQWIRFDRLIWDMCGTQISSEGKQTVLELRPQNVLWVPPEAFEIAASGQYAMGKWLTGLGAAPAAVFFLHGSHCDEAIYQQVFQCRNVYFNQPRTALIFASDFMSAPLRYADPSLKSLMGATGENMLAQHQRDANIANDTRAAIYRLLPTAEQNFDIVATQLDLSPRDFSKKLQTAGYQFKDLVEEVWRDLADYYLSFHTLLITEIAFLPGYSEQSAFSRTVKKWTGVTPSTPRESRYE